MPRMCRHCKDRTTEGSASVGDVAPLDAHRASDRGRGRSCTARHVVNETFRPRSCNTNHGRRVDRSRHILSRPEWDAEARARNVRARGPGGCHGAM
jgi:hypothetical protein